MLVFFTLSFILSILFPVILLLLLTARVSWMLRSRSNSWEWRLYPEFDQLATIMGVTVSKEINRRWGVGRVGQVARTNPIEKQILVDRKYFFKFPPGEQSALIAHELAHLKCRHSLYSSLIVFAGIVLSLVLALLTSSPIFSTSSLLVFLVITVLYRRRSEFQADQVASAYVAPSTLVSALSKFAGGKSNRWNNLTAGLTHPRIQNRLEKLEQLQRYAVPHK